MTRVQFDDVTFAGVCEGEPVVREFTWTLIDLTPAYINQSATAPPQMQIRMRRDVKPDLRDLRRSLRSAVFVIWNTMRDVYHIITVVSPCFQDVLPANLCIAFARFPFYSRRSKAKWELVWYTIVTVASVLQRSTKNDHVSPTSCHLNNTVAWFGTRMIPIWFQFHDFDRNVQVARNTFFTFIYNIKNWIYQNYFDYNRWIVESAWYVDFRCKFENAVSGFI